MIPGLAAFCPVGAVVSASCAIALASVVAADASVGVAVVLACAADSARQVEITAIARSHRIRLAMHCSCSSTTAVLKYGVCLPLRNVRAHQSFAQFDAETAATLVLVPVSIALECHFGRCICTVAHCVSNFLHLSVLHPPLFQGAMSPRQKLAGRARPF